MYRNVLRVFAFASLLLAALSAPAFSQCLVATPNGSGNGSGSNWSNAISAANLTSKVTRGNIYYLAAGLYAFSDHYQTFSTADSGTTPITIRAATVADHGAAFGCSTIGWTNAMGASGSNQVVFRCTNCLSATFKSQMGFSTDYWILDGNDPTRTTISDSSADYNMMIDDSWLGGASDGSGLGFHVFLYTGVHNITLQAIEYKGTGLDAMNVDTQAIASISCLNGSTARVQLAGQRNHPYLYVGEWVTIGGTASHDKDTTQTLSASQQQIGSTTNGQFNGCTNAVGNTAVCTMYYAFVPVISTDGSQSIIVASNAVSNYNGTWPVTGINPVANTISFTIATSGNPPGNGGNATWNGSGGTQIQSVTQGSAVCAPGVQCSDDWTQPFTVSGNGYTCSGGPEATGVMAGPDSEAGGGIYVNASVANSTFNYSYGHDFLGLWDLNQDSNITIMGNACERVESSDVSPFHASCLADSGTSGLSFAYNRVLDTEGTGDVGALSRGTVLTSQNWNIYGNVFGLSDFNPYQRHGGGGGNGQVFCINVVTCNNWTVLNNTIVGTGGSTANRWGFEAGGGQTNTNITCQDNLAYDTTQSNGTFALSLCTSESNNTYIDLGANTPPLGTGDNAVNSQPDPFVSSLNHNYQIISETVAPDLNVGVNTNATLLANQLDPAGTLRGSTGSWDLGAFQFTAAPPAPATAANAAGH